MLGTPCPWFCPAPHHQPPRSPAHAGADPPPTMAKTITVEQATAAMNAAVAALEEPANAADLAAAKAKAAGNLMVLLQTLMPKV